MRKKSAKYAEKIEKYAEIKCLFMVTLINFIYTLNIFLHKIKGGNQIKLFRLILFVYH